MIVLKFFLVAILQLAATPCCTGTVFDVLHRVPIWGATFLKLGQRKKQNDEEVVV
jgi:hypothetical protein